MKKFNSSITYLFVGPKSVVQGMFDHAGDGKSSKSDTNEKTELKELQKTLFASGVKIAGKNEKKSLTVLANEMDLTVDELKQLNTGEFYLQVSNYLAVKIKTPKYLL